MKRFDRSADREGRLASKNLSIEVGRDRIKGLSRESLFLSNPEERNRKDWGSHANLNEREIFASMGVNKSSYEKGMAASRGLP